MVGGAPDSAEGIAEFFNTGLTEEDNYTFLQVGKARQPVGMAAMFGYYYSDTDANRGAFICLKGDDYSLFVRRGGNVGIGQTSPVSKLHLGNDENDTGYITMEELSADASAPSANRAALFVRDNGSGKTQLCVRFNSGAVQVLATQP